MKGLVSEVERSKRVVSGLDGDSDDEGNGEWRDEEEFEQAVSRLMELDHELGDIKSELWRREDVSKSRGRRTG